MTPAEVSVVVPLHNEAPNVQALHRELLTAASAA